MGGRRWGGSSKYRVGSRENKRNSLIEKESEEIDRYIDRQKVDG